MSRPPHSLPRRPRPQLGRTPATDGATPQPAAAPTPSAAPRVSLDTARRVIESVIIAVVTSTGLYLVGTVYTSAYFGRLSIDATALDLAPPFIALQAVHVVPNLLEYPVVLGVVALLSRVVAARLPAVRAWAERVTQRFGRLTALIVNILIVLPLLTSVVVVLQDAAVVQASDVLSEVGRLMQIVGLALVVYLLWLSLGRQEFLLTQVRQHKLLPIALLAALYFLDALVVTADRAEYDAELLMTGLSDASLAVTFTMAPGADFSPPADLLLVAIRNGHYFVVERQSPPPSSQPKAFAIPVRAVDAIQLQRVNPSTSTFIDLLDAAPATPTTP